MTVGMSGDSARPSRGEPGPVTPSVDIHVVDEAHGYVVVARGALDVAAVEPVLRAAHAVRAAHTDDRGPLVIDLTDVDFMDSEGLRALLLARRLWRDSPDAIVLRNPSAAVLSTLDLAGIADAFAVDRTPPPGATEPPEPEGRTSS
jgi:anti-anti-sigma factor